MDSKQQPNLSQLPTVILKVAVNTQGQLGIASPLKKDDLLKLLVEVMRITLSKDESRIIIGG